MASSEEEPGKRKSDSNASSDGEAKKDAKTDPLSDIVLAVERKGIEAWTMIKDGLKIADVPPCTEYEIGRMVWKYYKPDGVSLQVHVEPLYESYGAKAKFILRTYTDRAQYREFSYDQWGAMIDLLKKWIELTRIGGIRDEIHQTLHNEDVHWTMLMRCIIDDPKMPFFPTHSIEGNQILLQWKTETTCVTVERVKGSAGMCFVVRRPEKPSTADNVYVSRECLTESLGVVAKVKEWLPLV